MGRLFTGRFRELEPALAGRVRELRRGRPLAPLTVVVGTTALAAHVQALLASALAAYAGIEVVTLGRFARRLAARRAVAVGRPLAHPLPWLVRERLVRRLLAERHTGPGLAYFAPVADAPGLAAAFVRTIDDLRQAGLAPGAELQAAITRRDKGADMAILYAAYCDALTTSGLADEAGVYELAVAAVEQSAAVAGTGDERATMPAAGEAPRWGRPEPAESRPGEQIALPFGDSGGDGRALAQTGSGHAGAPSLILYGLADVNAVQRRLIEALVAAGPADAFVPEPVGAASWSQPLVALLLAAGLIARPLAPAPPHGAADAMTRRLFGAVSDGRAPNEPASQGDAALVSQEAPVVPGDDSLCIVSAMNERAEAREAVRECLAAASRGVRFHQMAVVVPTAEHAAAVAEAFAATGVPVARQLPDGSRFTRSLLRLLDAVAPVRGEPFERRALVEFLVTAELRGHGAQAHAALWTDEARRAGVVSGPGQWRERLGRHAGRLQASLAELQAGDHDEDDGPFSARIAALERRVSAAAALLRAVERVTAAVEGLPVAGTWSEMAAALGGLVDALVVTPPDCGIDDELAALASLAVIDGHTTLPEAVAVLREAVGRRRVPHGRVGREGVALLTPLEARGLAFRLVIVAGLGEGGFPPRPSQDPVLLDADRTRIAECCGVALRPVGSTDDEAEFLFATTCEVARERLVLLFPRLDAATGRPRLPSRFLVRAVETLAGRRVALDELDGALPPTLFRRVGPAPVAVAGRLGAVDEHELDVALLAAAAGDGLERRRRDVARTYLASLLGDDATERRRRQWEALNSPEVGPWDGLLTDPAALAWLAAHDPFRDEVSPTAVERYVRCPFAFLLRDVLGLLPPEEPAAELEIENTTFGDLAHAILQGVYQRVAEGGLSRDEALVALPPIADEICARAERDGQVGAAAVWRGRRRLLLDDLTHAVRIDSVFDSGGRPLHLEWRFGTAHERPVALPLADGELRFRGRVDRIDQVPGESLVVIDYKTGSGSAEGKRLGSGRSVQLAAYLLAARQLLQPRGGISCSYRLVTRRGGFADRELPDDEKTTLRALAALCSAVGDATGAGLFPRSPVNTWDCRQCDLRYACDLGAWAHGQKREAPPLQLVRRIQESSWREEVMADGE